jgi:CubicO group peptidase (beta-lactamase class C family)
MHPRFVWALIGPALAAAPAVAQPRASHPGLIDRFEAGLARLAADGLFSGTVVIARDGVPLLEQAHGRADRASATPVTAATRFNVGSMNKMFTAVAVLQLARAGRLSLDGRLIEVLPSYPNAAVARRVTIHQLLTHTAGVGDFLMKMLAAPAREYQRLEDYLPYFVDDSLAFEPGARWAYSNGGYLILGLVIEALTGQPYGELIRDSVLAPARMTGTGFQRSATAREEVYATNYSRMRSPDGVEREFRVPGHGGPAGGGYSTASDLVRFAHALRSGILLDSVWTERLISGKVDLAPGGSHRYAYGFFSEDLAGLSLVGHGGGGPGINGELTLYRGTGYTIAVLANIDPPAATNVKRLFDGLLLDATGRLPAPASAGNTEFVLAGHGDAHLVTVSGDFNGWQPWQHRLGRIGDRWVGRVELPRGRHRYRFFVDGRELLDPANPDRETVPGLLRQQSSVITVQ